MPDSTTTDSSASQLLDTLRAAMLPMDGNIAEHVSAIFAAFEQEVAPRQWHDITYVDFSAGSCLLPMLFGAHGVGRLVVNDTAPRSVLAAQALFGGRPVDVKQVRELVTGASPRLRAHTPTFHFACDYLT